MSDHVKKMELLLWKGSKDELTEFREFLHDQYSHENLSFWLEVEEFRNQKDMTQVEIRAKEIFRKYFSEESTYELNVPAKTRLEIQEKLKTNCTLEIFKEAQYATLILMAEDCYPKFIASQRYKNLKEKKNRDYSRIKISNNKTIG